APLLALVLAAGHAHTAEPGRAVVRVHAVRAGRVFPCAVAVRRARRGDALEACAARAARRRVLELAIDLAAERMGHTGVALILELDALARVAARLTSVRAEGVARAHVEAREPENAAARVRAERAGRTDPRRANAHGVRLVVEIARHVRR